MYYPQFQIQEQQIGLQVKKDLLMKTDIRKIYRVQEIIIQMTILVASIYYPQIKT
jgi:hypothetical protein